MKKFCSNCGKEMDVDSIFCPFCGKKLDNSVPSTNSVSSNNNVVVRPNSDDGILYHPNLRVMAPSRLFLYNTFTLGIYSIYWFYKNNKVLRDAFNKDVNVALRTIGLFIPIVNWVMYIFFLSDFEELLQERGLQSFSVVANFIFLAILPLFGLNIFALLNVQEYINDLCMYEEPNLKINRKYSGAEIALMVLAGIILIAAIFFVVILLLSPLFMFH